MCILVFVQLVGGDKPYISPQLLEIEHTRIMDAMLAMFHATKKMGGAEFSQPFANRLSEELLEHYGNFQKHNESKNILAAARTPAVLFIVMVVCYVLAGLFALIYANNLAALCNLVMGIALIMLALWAYVRYSGSYREVGVYVDGFADFLWMQVSLTGLSVLLLYIQYMEFRNYSFTVIICIFCSI